MLLILLGVSACSKNGGDDATGDTSTNDYSSGNPLTAPTDYLEAVAKGQKKAANTINMASVTQAVDLYYAAEGSYAESLQKLVDEGYLAAIPEAPAGKVLIYDPKTGSVTLEAKQP